MTPIISIFPPGSQDECKRFKRFLSVSLSNFDDFNLCQSTLPAVAACFGLCVFLRSHETPCTPNLKQWVVTTKR